MKPAHRRLLIFVVALVIIGVSYFGYRLYAVSWRTVPHDFSEARARGSVASEKIVSNSNDIAASMAIFSSPTSSYVMVSSTIGQVLDKVSELHSQAVELAGTLEAMTKAVADIRSSQAQQVALEAISYRLTVVSRLVTYSDQVNRLALAMRLRLESGIRNNQEISSLIEDINIEVDAVNKFSVMADEAMEEFDSILR